MSFMLISSPKKSGRTGLAALVIAALTLHGFIPLGYMPDVARHASQPLAMTICTGMGPMHMVMPGMADPVPAKKDGNGKKLQDHAPPCPFSVNAVFTSGSIATCCTVPFIFYGLLSALIAFAFVRLPRFGNAAPRAPPIFS